MCGQRGYFSGYCGNPQCPRQLGMRRRDMSVIDEMNSWRALGITEYPLDLTQRYLMMLSRVDVDYWEIEHLLLPVRAGNREATAAEPTAPAASSTAANSAAASPTATTSTATASTAARSTAASATASAKAAATPPAPRPAPPEPACEPEAEPDTAG